jgi:hypothetical protein
VSPWQRDLIAIAGVGFLIAAAYLIHPALALAIIGGSLLFAWTQMVPEKDEPSNGP